MQSIGYEQPSDGVMIAFHFSTENIPDHATDRSGGWLAGLMNLVSQRLKTGAQQGDLGAFATTVDAFEGYEQF